MRDHLMMNICHVPVNFLDVIPNSYGNSAQIGMFIFIVQTQKLKPKVVRQIAPGT